MWIVRTTGCCSASALLGLSAVGVGVGATTSAPLTLFPLQPMWSASLGAVLSAPPVLTANRAYFALDDDRLVAYELSDGTERWTETIRTAVRPALGEGLVFLVSADALVAMQQEDGTLAWQQPFDEPLASPPVFDNGWLLTAGRSGTISAFRAGDGTLIWRQQLDVAVNAPPSLAADRVYVPLSDNRVAALQVETGALVWDRRLGGRPNDLLAHEDRLYVGSDDNFFYCLRADTGQIDWRWRTGADVIGLPAADDRRVYFVSLDNVLRAVHRTSGVQHWKRALPLRPTRGPLLAGGSLVISGIGQTLPAFAVEDGRPSGELDATGDVVAGPFAFEIFGLPAVVVVTHDLATGAVVRGFGRRVEPAITPVSPLPDPFVPLPLNSS